MFSNKFRPKFCAKKQFNQKLKATNYSYLFAYAIRVRMSLQGLLGQRSALKNVHPLKNAGSQYFRLKLAKEKFSAPVNHDLAKNKEIRLSLLLKMRVKVEKNAVGKELYQTCQKNSTFLTKTERKKLWHKNTTASYSIERCSIV